MSADKHPSIFSRQVEAIGYLSTGVWRLSEAVSHVLDNHFSFEFKRVKPAKFAPVVS